MPANINTVLVQNYVKQLELFSNTTLVTSETNTKNKLIEPLLELLGWNVRGTEVLLEYAIRIGSKSVHVDYALLHEDEPVIFVEAKPYSAELNDDYSNQIISYCRVDSIRWSALTNGRKLKIFDSQRGKNEKGALVCEIDLSNPSEFMEELSILHKESMQSGETEDLVDRIMTHKKAIRKIKDSKSDLINGFSKTISSIVDGFDTKRIEIIASQLATTTINLLDQTNSSSPKAYPEITQKESEQKPKKRKNWHDRLEWTTPPARDMALKLVAEVMKKFPDASHGISGTDYYFAKGKRSQQTLFLTITIQKNRLNTRVRFDPQTGKDPSGMVEDRDYEWFFKGRGKERNMKILDIKNISQALEVINQSYNLAG
jgi:predicted type IV restriction endonuclease